MKYSFTFSLDDATEILIVKSNPIEAISQNEAIMKLLVQDETLKSKRNEGAYKLVWLKVEETK